MNHNIITLTSAVIISCSSIVCAESLNPPAISDIYAMDPNSTLTTNTDLSNPERSAFALYDGIMDVAEARIHASSCSDAIGEYKVNIFSDGRVRGRRQNNTVLLTSSGGSYRLFAIPSEPVTGRGVTILLYQLSPGTLEDMQVNDYTAQVTYNDLSNLMTSNSKLEVESINAELDTYATHTVKSLYRDSLSDSDRDFYNISDWGLNMTSKLGYPVNKNWQRSKSRRDDGNIARTVFVRDSLIQTSPCRITIDTNGYNNINYFWQEGSLKIESVTPGAQVSAFDEFPFNEVDLPAQQ
ncbi:MAG: hypothetical protein KGZ88_00055 [Methylomicrobium sp.]|nr:hypothetical protein [Methylomicrobium sp.]